MSLVEFTKWVIGSLCVLLSFIGIVTSIINKKFPEDRTEIKRIYLHRLNNSDSSVKDAMQYLKLTNSISERTSKRYK